MNATDAVNCTGEDGFVSVRARFGYGDSSAAVTATSSVDIFIVIVVVARRQSS